MFGDDNNNNNNIYLPNIILFIHFIFPFIAEYIVRQIFEINKNVGTQVCINIKLCYKKKKLIKYIIS